MPPEPSHWDRKDLLKEKKLEKSDTISSVGRWRDFHHGSRDLGRFGSNDFRRLQGHGKQGGYQLSSEDSGYGCTISRSSERMVDDDVCRPSASLVDVKYGRSSRESKGFCSQKDWKGTHLWEERETDASFSSLGRQHEMKSQRSADDLLTYSSSLPLDVENSLGDQNDTSGVTNGLGSGHKYEKDHLLESITWKPLKWTRSSSLSSRGSGFSHSGSYRSIKSDSDVTKPELQHGKVPPSRIVSCDASAAVDSAVSFEDSCSRKKQRLGWGQGLAKYEKQKVEIPDETVGKSGLVLCSNYSHNGPLPSLSDRSPRITGLSECASPATPSSVAWSSSPGADEKSYAKGANIDNDMSNLSDSPAQGFQNCLEEFSLSLENLEINPRNNLSSLLADLLQAEDASSGDSCFVRSTGTNKLLLLKSDILKAVEKTEFEIDLFETELKSLNSELEIGGSCLRLRGLDSLQVKPKDSDEVCDASNVLPNSAPLQVASFGDIVEEKPVLHNDTFEEVSAGVGDDDVNSPGTAMSKCVEPQLMENPDTSAAVFKHEESSVDIVAARSTTEGVQCLFPTDEKNSVDAVDANHLFDIGITAQMSSDSSSQDGITCHFHAPIFAANKDTARKASELFSKRLPSEHHQVDILGVSGALCLQNRALVKEKLVTRKRFLRFKERVLTLKFRAFQHLWKEDMRLLSIRKSRPKSQKRFELSSRSLHAGHQKSRSSIRSRFSSPAGNLTLVPTSEIIDFASKLLSNSQIKLCRNSLKMPALILDEKERNFSRFISANGLVEDPCAVEKERSMVNPWTSKEKEIFMEMLATFGKDFRKIASFLDHKTVADCIVFYYKNQKSVSFEKIKKRLQLKKQQKICPTNTYMVTSGKKWNREANAASLDILGAASVIAAQADESMKTRSGESYFSGGFNGFKTSRGDAGLEGWSSVGILANEKEAAAADALAGICGALSSEAMSSCVTSSVDPGEGFQEWKSHEKNYRSSRPLTPEVSQHVDDEETCSDDSCGELDLMDWTDDEKSIFIQAVRIYGKDFVKISRYVGTRSRDQCRIFFSKSQKCLGLYVMPPGPNNSGMPVSDSNGRQGDTEDACFVEMESAICSTQSSSKMDVDMDAAGNAGATNLEADMDRSIEEKQSGQSEQVISEKVLGTVVAEDDQAVRERGFDGDIKSMELKGSEVCAAQDVILRSEQNLDVQESPALTAEKNCGRQSMQTSVSPVDEAVSSGGTNGTEALKFNSSVDLQAEPGAACEHNMRSEGSQSAAFENGLVDTSHPKVSPDTKNSVSTSWCDPSNSAMSSGSSIVEDGSIHAGFCSTSSIHNKVPLELSSVHEPQIISCSQKNCPISARLELHDSSVHVESHICQPMSSLPTPKIEEMGSMPWQASETHVYHKYLLRHSNQSDTSQVLRGYPLRLLNKKEDNLLKASRDQNLQQYLVQDLCHEKCNGSLLPHVVSELPFLHTTQEQPTSDHPRTHSLSGSDMIERSSRTGDVKLFGQILSHPLPLQKSDTSCHRGDDKRSSSETNGMPFKLQAPIDKGVDHALHSSKVDRSRYSGLDDIPLRRSYGFWDGNRIQTGLPTLPDSAILLAKYPATFGDFATSSCMVEERPVSPVVKKNDSVSVFQSKDGGCGGGPLPDIAAYRSFDGTKVQPFTVDVRRHDVLLEMQKRNGYEGMLSFQQQGRVVGMNVVGGGIHVGGNCAGVSDPVAAMQMHYASVERYGGQAGSLREEAWRRGDLGR